MFLTHLKISILVGLFYFIFALISFEFSRIAGGSATLIWLPTGLSIACVLKFGTKSLPSIYLAGVAASLYIGNSLMLSLLFAIANTVEPVIALAVLKRMQFSLKLYHFKDYLNLILASITASLVSAVLGVVALLSMSLLNSELFWPTMLKWWAGNIIGFIMLGPLLLLLSQMSLIDLVKKRSLEFGLLIFISSMIAITQFAGISVLGIQSSLYYVHFAIAVLIWALIRFDYQIIALIKMLLLSSGVWGFIHQQGYFYSGLGFVEKNVDILFQYVFVATLGTMWIAYTLKQQRTLSQALTKSKSETYIFNQDDFQLEFINLSARQNLGLNDSNWRKLTILDVFSRVDKELIFDKINDFKTSNDVFDVFQSLQQRLDGTVYPVEVRLELVEESGHYSYLMNTIDISERLESQIYKDLGDSVFHCSTQGVAVCNEQSEIIRVNKAFCHITGYSEQEVIGNSLSILHSDEYDSSFYDDMWATVENEDSWCGELYKRHQAGHLYLASKTITKFKHELTNKVHYVVMFSDITTEREDKLRLKYTAEHDALTALPNRVRLEQEFIHAANNVSRKQKKLAILFLDLNNFKPINDQYGHQFGDLVLKHVAIRLKNIVRDSDMVARVGGDEFVVLISHFEQEKHIYLLKDKIKLAVSEPMLINGIDLKISVSIGYATFPIDGSNLEQLINAADQAMYIDKKQEKSPD